MTYFVKEKIKSLGGQVFFLPTKRVSVVRSFKQAIRPVKTWP